MSDNEPLLQLMRDLGYSVLFRRLDWTDCLLQLDGKPEQHLGSGKDEEGAFRAALALALPTELARRLLHRALAVPVASPDADARAEQLPVTAAPPLPARDSPTLSLPAPEPPETASPALATPVVEPACAVPAPSARQASPAPEPVAAVPSAPPPAVPTLTTASAQAPAPPPAPASAPAARTHAPSATPTTARASEAATRGATVPPLAADEAIAGLGELFAQAEGSSLGALAPEWLRLRLLFWMCRGRGLEERVSTMDQHAVIPACARLARRLTVSAKFFWPGSVRALQLDASPMDVRRELMGLGACDIPFLGTWEAAAAAAGTLLRQLQDGAAAAGVDDKGWADGRFLTPPPGQPEQVLAECVGTLAEILGPGVVARGDSLVEARDHRVVPLADAVLEPLVRVAQRLRWVRVAVPHPIDPLSWGIAMGAVRWAMSGLDDKSRRRLGEVLQA